MKAGVIAAALEEFAPLDTQESWDNAGFSIGSAGSEVHGAVFGLDCTHELLDFAVSCGADMVVTHHPLIFKGIRKISEETYVGSLILRAVRLGLTVYSSHTPMDKAVGGVSGLMASRMGLEDVSVLEDDGSGRGLGIAGTLPEPMAADDFIISLKKWFSLETVRCSRLPETKISRVAACGGSGASLIEAARMAGADAMVTGDVTYHYFLTDAKMLVADIGHFESECDIVKMMCDIVKEKIPTFAARTINSVNNPVYYY